MEQLAFIQMSDIHFHKSSGTPYDVNGDIRNAAIQDVKTIARDTIRMINGILVCGDIAFSAQPKEYEIAWEFLSSIMEVYSLERSDVFFVAGNHDVDQGFTRKSPLLIGAHRRLTEMEEDWLDAEIGNIQNDVFQKGILYYPLENYNEAVKESGSAYTLQSPFWQTFFPFQSYKLCIHGMNSVMTSSHLDHVDDHGRRLKEERKMVVNKGQLPGYDPKIIYLSMCHHPPRCWNHERLSSMMDARVKLQLYGHMHEQSIDADEHRVRIYSGAIQPVRGEGWKPQYNWIRLSIEKDRNLLVDVYPRVYDENKGMFRKEADACDPGELYKRCVINLKEDEPEKQLSTHGRTDIKNVKEKNARRMSQTTKKIVYNLYLMTPEKKRQLRSRYPGHDFEVQKNGVDEIIEWLQKEQMEEEFLHSLTGG